MIPDKKTEYLLPLPIGTSEAGNQLAPSWEVNFLRSELSSSQGFISDGNQAVGGLLFDIDPDDPNKKAKTLVGTTFKLTDTSGKSITYSFNAVLATSHGTCTAQNSTICLDVNDDDSTSPTSFDVAQQVASKINNSVLGITATVPFNDGVVKLVQDAVGHQGNTDIVFSNEVDYRLKNAICIGAMKVDPNQNAVNYIFHPAYLGGDAYAEGNGQILMPGQVHTAGAYIEFVLPAEAGTDSATPVITGEDQVTRIVFDKKTINGNGVAGPNAIGIGTNQLDLVPDTLTTSFSPNPAYLSLAQKEDFLILKEAVKAAINGTYNSRVTPATSGYGQGSNGVAGIAAVEYSEDQAQYMISLKADTKDSKFIDPTSDDGSFSKIKINSPSVSLGGWYPLVKDNDATFLYSQYILSPSFFTTLPLDAMPKIQTDLDKNNFRKGTDSTFAPLQIPQLNIDVYYDTEIGQISNAFETSRMPAPQQNSNEIMEENMEAFFPEDLVFEDGSIVKVTPDYLLLDIKENNVSNMKENFEIEVYRVPNSYGNVIPSFPSLTSEDDLQRLRFAANQKKYFQEGDKIYFSQEKKTIQLSKENVEYYFDLRVDKEIQEPVDMGMLAPGNSSILPTNADQELCDD